MQSKSIYNQKKFLKFSNGTRKFLIISGVLFISGMVIFPALAQLPNDLAPAPNIGWTGPSNLIWLGNYIARFMFTLFLILAVIFYIWAALMYLTAVGEEKKITQARQALIYGAIAMIVALLAFGGQTIIQNFLCKGTGGPGGSCPGTSIHNALPYYNNLPKSNSTGGSGNASNTFPIFRPGKPY